MEQEEQKLINEVRRRVDEYKSKGITIKDFFGGVLGQRQQCLSLLSAFKQLSDENPGEYNIEEIRNEIAKDWPKDKIELKEVLKEWIEIDDAIKEGRTTPISKNL